MRRLVLVLALSGAVTAALGWAACSSEEQAAPPGKDGGAGAGGTGGLGGNGATGGTLPSGGTGGSGGLPGDAGEWGALPVWEGFPGSAVGCTYERLTNAAQIRFFKWEACSWTEGCEQALFNPVVLGQDANFIRTSVVVDDGTTVRVGLTMWTKHNVAIIAGDDGMGLDAFRDTSGDFDCRLAATSVWQDQFAIHLQDHDAKHFGGIVGTVGQMAASPVVFTIPEPPPVGGPQQFVLGNDRWLWWWTPVDRLSTVSSKDGSDFQMFAKAVGSIMGYSDSATTGPLFLAQEYELNEAGSHVQGKIAYSDGVSPMKPYLVPPDPNDDYGYPAFANSHVGFMKGIGQKDVNLYDSVEIWATPYSADPSQLKPELVAGYPFTNMHPMVGGWGRLGTATSMPDGSVGVGIWSIAQKSAKAYTVPNDHTAWVRLGLTHTHLWMGAQKPAAGVDAYLMRFKVE
jgi:hypothetical protein